MNADNFLTGIEVKFHIFMNVGKDEPATYVERGTAHGGPESIIDLVKERAEQMAGDKYGIELSPDDFFTRIYKVQLLNNGLRCMSLTTTDESAFHGGESAGFYIQGENSCGPLQGGS